MFDTRTLQRIISGEQPGLLASLLRICFRALEPIYRFIIYRRNQSFDSGRGVVQVGKPVVSVGNITTGGTGKTPLIMWLVERLSKLDYEVVLLSRGYSPRGSGNGGNDEAKEIARRFPEVVHRQAPDRVASARQVMKEVPLDLFLLDDGFQHRRLARDLDIVLIDVTRPFGYGRLLPAGFLREPVTSLARADIVVLTRCEQVTEIDLQEVERTIQRVVKTNGESKSLSLFRASTLPIRLVSLDGEIVDCESVRGAKCVSFCAIGNPSAFAFQLHQLGVRVLKDLVYPDHHEFTAEDLQQIEESSNALSADVVICTQKDRVKLPEAMGVHVLSLEIGLDIEQSEEFLRRIEAVLKVSKQ